MPVARAFALVVFAAIALTATGCGGSNNKGKIEGKWKITSAPDFNEEAKKALELFKATPYMEFKADGTVTSGIDATPEVIKLMESGGEKMTQNGTYKLLAGNNVELTGIGETKGGLFGGGKGKAGRVVVVITGDNMSITEANGTLQLTRWK